MLKSILNILRLTGKELRAIRGDRVMVVLIFYVFSVAVWLVSNAASTEVEALPVAVVDEDHSPLSARIIDEIRAPLFADPVLLSPKEAARAQSEGRYVLVVTLPPDLERDLRRGEAAEIQILADATAVAFAGNGAAFMTQVLSETVRRSLAPGAESAALVDVVFRYRFNPNTTSRWFTTVMQLMNNVTILMLILSGASLIRERERGTVEHVLVMPVRPHEIVLSKIFANGGVILLASVASLIVVVQGLLRVPIDGSFGLYVFGAALYVVAVASIGLMLASFTDNMGQFGLLVIPVIIIMILLSGGLTPLESMPDWLQTVMHMISPATHFVAFAQAVLYRSAGIEVVMPKLGLIAAMSAVALSLVLARFRKILS